MTLRHKIRQMYFVNIIWGDIDFMKECRGNIPIYSDFFSIDALFQSVLMFRVICIVNTDLKSMKMAVN
jgi:hypothetical protein